MTLQNALAIYGDQVAKKWGEAERAAGVAMMRGKSIGLVLNAAARYDAANPDEALIALAKQHATKSDRMKLVHAGRD